MVSCSCIGSSAHRWSRAVHQIWVAAFAGAVPLVDGCAWTVNVCDPGVAPDGVQAAIHACNAGLLITAGHQHGRAAGFADATAADFSVFVGDLAPDVTDYVLQETFRTYYPSVRSAKVIDLRSTSVQPCSNTVQRRSLWRACFPTCGSNMKWSGRACLGLQQPVQRTTSLQHH